MRHYLIPSWVGSCEDHANWQDKLWSGESPDYRKGKSKDVMDYYTPSASEAKQAPKPKKKKPNAYERVCLADRNYSRLEQEKQELDTLLDEGEISWNDWLYAMKQLQPRMDRAWKKIVDLRGWQEQDDSESITQHEEPIENSHYTSYNESPIVDSWQDELFHSLSDSNIFKIAYIKIKRIAEALK